MKIVNDLLDLLDKYDNIDILFVAAENMRAEEEKINEKHSQAVRFP